MGTRGSADVIVRFNPIQLMDDYLISIRSHSSILLYVLRFMVLTAIWRLLMDASGRSMGKASTRITTGRCWNLLLWFVVPFLGSSHDSHIFLSRLSHPKKLHTFMCTRGTYTARSALRHRTTASSTNRGLLYCVKQGKTLELSYWISCHKTSISFGGRVALAYILYILPTYGPG